VSDLPIYPWTLMARHDRWLYWPAPVVVVLMTILCFIVGLPGTLSFLMIPLSVLLFLLIAVAIIIFLCTFIYQRQFRKAISVALALALPVFLGAQIQWVADCLHLALTVTYGFGVLNPYQARHAGALVEFSPVPPDSTKPFAFYDWSVGLAGGPSTFLIHDISDEVALPVYQSRDSSKTEYSIGEFCRGKVRHLVGHYYVCVF